MTTRTHTHARLHPFYIICRPDDAAAALSGIWYVGGGARERVGERVRKSERQYSEGVAEYNMARRVVTIQMFRIRDGGERP